MSEVPDSPLPVRQARAQTVGHTLQFDPKHQVWLITLRGVVTEASALDACAAVERFIAAEGPWSGIADLSAIEKAEISGESVRSLAAKRPVAPGGKVCILVTAQDVIYGLSRMFQILRDQIGSNIQIVHTLEEAFALLGLESPEFRMVEVK